MKKYGYNVFETLGFNRNILYCKYFFNDNSISDEDRFNRNILYCKCLLAD